MAKAKKKFILARKLGMTQLFDEEGNVHPVTLLEVGPVTVTQVKTKEKDGYRAIQLGFEKRRKSSKPLLGHLKELAEGSTGFRSLREWRLPEERAEALPSRGGTIDVSLFEKGEHVHVSALSKGRGFQGPVKRHGFAGGPRSHGQKHHHRAPGSLGPTALQRVRKGRRMAGHMGMRRVTVKNLKVIEVVPDSKILALEGAVPGARGALVEVYQ